MATEETHGSIFISYAWGNGFSNKEWIRQSILSNLTWKYDVFWDRDSIAIGESITRNISIALEPRPLIVLCLCDQAYLDAAQRKGSGLYDELSMLSKIADEPGVRIVPLILEPGCSKRLPAPLTGRVYLDLQPLHEKNIDIGATILGVAEGRTQSQLQSGIDRRVAVFNLRNRALDYLMQRPLELWGNGRTNEVTVRPEYGASFLLKPPQWMWQSSYWNYFLKDEFPNFCPAKGRWYWDYTESSSEMRPLATATAAMFFPQLTGRDEQELLNMVGTLLATKFFRMNYSHEPFVFNASDLVNALIPHAEGFGILEQLLDAVEAVRKVATPCCE